MVPAMPPVWFQIVLGPVEVVPEVDSTNRVLLERAREGAAHGLVLVADHQTAGRGRLGRTWEAPPGSALLVSVLLRPHLAPTELFHLTWAAGLAAVDAVATFGVEARLKWPNDVLVEDRKLAGILAESTVTGSEIGAVVVGMGLNLRSIGIPPTGVALDEVGRAGVARDELLSGWLTALEGWLDADRSALVESYNQRCATLGRPVRVERSEDQIEGVAVAVDEQGGLVLEDGRSFHAGDVVHLRPV
jgi:BirA family biotin operon repressor/biotin-[acetyl-CoA-carboxylase] ligase